MYCKVEDIVKNGGATLNKNGKMVTLKTGYQVSVKDIGVCEVKELTQQMVNNIVDYGIKQRGEYAGFWIEDGRVYCDVSKRIASKQAAIDLGKQLKQISIFNWQKNSCIYC